MLKHVDPSREDFYLFTWIHLDDQCSLLGSHRSICSLFVKAAAWPIWPLAAVERVAGWRSLGVLGLWVHARDHAFMRSVGGSENCRNRAAPARLNVRFHAPRHVECTGRWLFRDALGRRHRGRRVWPRCSGSGPGFGCAACSQFRAAERSGG